MNTRLVWNFEINQNNLLNFENLSAEREDIRWEARYFWPGETIISLNGLDERFLALSDYEAKHRQDRYALLANHNFNIKQRRMQWLYKPLFAEVEGLRAYGKKIDLDECLADEILPGSNGVRAQDLIEQIEKNQTTVDLVKEALIYKFPSEPTIKLELARLKLKEAVYFSLCVEGRSQFLVSLIAKHLLGTQVSCDYVSFLKQSLTL
ncbi:hypothetical protein BN59_00792 [Legionella massiliensis]|uniref:Uncharacterized protein n=1 Tax=Legionella massiliensis TaxID=1034943 RepID=A0A078KU66_9GAMM|nr:hypothetical protein [Legionella massiliensis]CDZ76522.1 hypothetical protein BN59_00792 [Legionella massiliensis]CEE12260.1 hypothetical protein BN1094_00792 [Legionella massiliensis]